MRILLTKIIVAWLIVMPLASCAVSADQGALEELKRMRAAEFFNVPAQKLLAEAIERGDLDQARAAIEQGAEVNAVGQKGMTPLFWALAKQKIDSFRFLLEQGADPNVEVLLPTSFQEPRAGAIEMAARLEDTAYLRALLEHGGDPNTIVDTGWNMPVLYRAIMNRRPENVLLLLEFGADIDHRDNAGKTPLIEAVTARMFEIALLLLRQGADPTIANQWGNTPSDLVMQFGNRGIDRRTNDLAAFDEFVKELKARGLLQDNPPRFD